MKASVLIPIVPILFMSCSTNSSSLVDRPVNSENATDHSSASCTNSNFSFGQSEPEDEGVTLQQLVNLTDWIQANPRILILSVLISKNGHLVYQVLTSSLTGEEAQYLMPATKSVTSSLVGVAIDKGNLQSIDQNISNLLPANLFASTEVQNTFSHLTLNEVLGMSALNAPVAPHDNSPAGQQRLKDWYNSKNRVAFALAQQLLANLGVDFLYTDITPSLAPGAVEYSTGLSLLDFANQKLFNPMGFSNQEWMHEDPSGIDNGAYGLRLRPID